MMKKEAEVYIIRSYGIMLCTGTAVRQVKE